MFYDQNPSIIESSDIVALRFSELEQLPNGTYVARLAVELDPHKAYSSNPSLHLTDGVLPRLLHPTPASVPPDEVPAESAEAATAEATKEKSKK